MLSRRVGRDISNGVSGEYIDTLEGEGSIFKVTGRVSCTGMIVSELVLLVPRGEKKTMSFF